MNLLKILSNLFVILLIPIFLISCGSNQDKLEKIKSTGELILGTSADYPPYEFPIISKTGSEEIVGFDIFIAREIAKDLGVKLTVKNLDFSGLLDALNSGSVDMILSGISPTEERRRSIDFSNIYYTARNVLVTSKDKAISSIEDLKGLTVGTQIGSIQDRIAQEKLKDSNIKSLLRVPELVLELLSKKVDAAVLEEPVAKQYVKANPDLKIVEISELNPSEVLGSAIGVKKNQQPLLEQINKTIERLINENKIDELFNESLKLFEENNKK